MADQVDKNSGVGKDADLASRVPNVISIPEITSVSAPETNNKKPAAKLNISSPVEVGIGAFVNAKAKAASNENAASGPVPVSVGAASDDAAHGDAGTASASDPVAGPEPDRTTDAAPKAAVSASSEGSAKATDHEGASRDESQAASAAASAVASKPEEASGSSSEFKLDPSRPSVKDSGRRVMAKGKRGKKGGSAKDDVSKRGSVKEDSVKRAALRKRLIAAGLVVLVIAAVALGVSWARWWRFDDAQDIQGQWFSANTTGTAIVNVDGETIRLASDVAYSYALDTTAKTIQYDFGPMHGQGRYWFSDDRSTLVIADGTDFTTTSTLLEDIALWWKGLFASITGAEKPVLQSDSSICLTRTDSSAEKAAEAETSANAGMGAGAESDAQKVTEAQQKAQQEQQERQAQLAAQKQEEQALNEAAADQQQNSGQVDTAGEPASDQPADSQQADQ